MYACMSACMYVFVYACMCACTYACMCVCMRACMYACMHVCAPQEEVILESMNAVHDAFQRCRENTLPEFMANSTTPYVRDVALSWIKALHKAHTSEHINLKTKQAQLAVWHDILTGVVAADAAKDSVEQWRASRKTDIARFIIHGRLFFVCLLAMLPYVFARFPRNVWQAVFPADVHWCGDAAEHPAEHHSAGNVLGGRLPLPPGGSFNARHP